MAIKNPQGSIVDLPRGVSDLNTRDSIALKEVIYIIEEVFKRYGFSPITTPAIENKEVLNAKAYGQESAKDMYMIEGGDTALRFDLTVPLARFMAMNKDIPMPFKRYQIGNVWRKDEPQWMRQREFLQADIDIVGSRDVQSDAECVAAVADALRAIGIGSFTILVNSRGILNSILNMFSIKEGKQGSAIRIIDKMSKVSMSETIKQLQEVGVDANNAEKLTKFITWGSTNEEKLEKLAVNVPDAKPEIEKIKEFMSILEGYGISKDVKVDFSLARGLDYYTGLVFEFSTTLDGQKTPSIAGGGRYDNLIGIYSKNSVPAVGLSIGLSRILELLKNKSERKSYANVFIAIIGKDNTQYAMSVAKKLRASKIYTDLNVTERGISKQLEYSNSIGVKYVAIIGNREKEAKKVNFRDMTAGTEELIDIDTLISRLKK